MNRPLYWLKPADIVLVGFLLGGAFLATGVAHAQADAPRKTDPPAGAQRQKHAPGQAGKTERPDAKKQGDARQTADGAARQGEPSAAYLESLRQTVERRRQRRARRQQGAADGSRAIGAIVPWPMPPALIIRHTREVHNEIGSLSEGLRRGSTP
jgi:hypothetical protein